MPRRVVSPDQGSFDFAAPVVPAAVVSASVTFTSTSVGSVPLTRVERRRRDEEERALDNCTLMYRHPGIPGVNPWAGKPRRRRRPQG